MSRIGRWKPLDECLSSRTASITIINMSTLTSASERSKSHASKSETIESIVKFHIKNKNHAKNLTENLNWHSGKLFFPFPVMLQQKHEKTKFYEPV